MLFLPLGLLAILLVSCSQSNSSSFGAGTSPVTSDVHIVASSPADGARDVRRDQLVTIELSHRMESKSFTKDTFRVEVEGRPVPGRVAASGRFASFLPIRELPAGSRHVVVLEGIRDAENRRLSAPLGLEFHTVPPAPFIAERTNPIDGQRNFDVDGTLEATFSEELDPGSIDDESFVLTSPAGRQPATLSVRGRTLFLRPNSFLAELTPYRARLSGDIRSTSGERLGSDVEIEFETGRFLFVVGVFPSPSAREVARDIVLRAELSRPLDPSSVDEASFVLTSATGEPVPGQVTSDGREARFDPSVLLDPEARYTARLDRSIRSLTGPPLGEDFEWSFETKPVVVPPMVFAQVGVNALPNQIVGFPLDESGRVEGAGSVTPTGGTGGLSLSIRALTLSSDRQFLFATNSRSADVSSFRLELDGSLVPVLGSPFPSAGTGAAAVTASRNGRWLYVGEPDSRTITIFDIEADGSLTKHASTFALPGRPFNVAASADGGFLFADFVSFPTEVELLRIEADGNLTSFDSLPSGSGGATGLASTTRHLFSTDWGDTGIYVYQTASWTPVSGSPFPNSAGSANPVDAALSPDGRYLYVVNRKTDNVSGFAIASDGSLSDVPGSPFPTELGPNALAVSGNGIVYVGNGESFSISSFRIQSNGSLATLQNGHPLPVTGRSVIGIAVTE